MKKIIARLLPERFVWFLSRLKYKIGLSKPFLWDIAEIERIVEYPWVWNNIRISEGKALDIGCCGTYFALTLASMGFEVWGVDKKQDKLVHPNFKLIQGNILDVDLPKDFFDLITIISTIEHIGLKDDGDFKCMERLFGFLKNGGFVLVTAPFGKSATFEGYRVYDADRIRKMWKGKIEKINFFRVIGEHKWVKTTEQEAANIQMESRGSCKGIFCAVLTK